MFIFCPSLIVNAQNEVNPNITTDQADMNPSEFAL
jgi:hypothetical protein